MVIRGSLEVIGNAIVGYRVHTRHDNKAVEAALTAATSKQTKVTKITKLLK